MSVHGSRLFGCFAIAGTVALASGFLPSESFASSSPETTEGRGTIEANAGERAGEREGLDGNGLSDGKAGSDSTIPAAPDEDFGSVLSSVTPVADAARDRQVDRVRELLRSGRDVNAAHGDGFSALHWAALHGDKELAEMLLYAGAHKEAKTRIGAHTPLMVAAKVGHDEIVALLVDDGAAADVSTANGATPLMLASAAGDVEAIEALLSAGASPWSREEFRGQTALHFAAAYGRTDAVRRLVAAGAEHCATTEIYDAVAAEKAIREKMIAKYMRGRKDAEAKKALGESGEAEDGEPKEDEGKSRKASKEGKSSDGETQVNSLVAADPDRKGQDQGKRRWWQRKSKVDEEEKKDPPRPLSYGQLVGYAGGMTPLHYAAREGHTETALALLDLGADVNHVSDGDRSTPLLVAVLNGHFDLAVELLDRGADPNIVSEAGAGPLYGAVNVYWAPHSFYPQPTSQYQQKTTLYEMLQALLDHGADPDQRLTKKVWYTGYNFDQSGIDETGATAFWRAAQAADVEAMKILRAGGADWTIATKVVPERRSPNGRNADKDLSKDVPELGDPAVSPFLVASGAGYVGNFHRVSPGGFLRASRYFVEELGADPNEADYQGRTAMHNAAMRGDNQMIVYYILHGASPHAVTRAGDNVADLANGPVQRIQPFEETLELLSALGVKHNDRCVSC